jgi:hypothetical protein
LQLTLFFFALQVLYSLLSKQIDIDVHFHVANTIANLASTGKARLLFAVSHSGFSEGNLSNHANLAAADSIGVVLELMLSEDSEVRLAGIRSIANLSSAKVLHPQLVQQGCVKAAVPFLKNVREPQARLFGEVESARAPNSHSDDVCQRRCSALS